MKFSLLLLIFAVLQTGCSSMDAPAERNTSEESSDAHSDAAGMDDVEPGRRTCSSAAECPSYEEANTDVTCKNSVCARTCINSFRHCASNPDTSVYCNTNTRTDPDNCGGCVEGAGLKCPADRTTHHRRVCQDSACSTNAKKCEPGFINTHDEDSDVEIADCVEE